MNSKITIEVDFVENNEPAIQVIFRPSDDIRDKLIQSFFNKLGQISSWCTVFCLGAMEETSVNYAAQRWLIKPIEATNLDKQADAMKEQARLINYATPNSERQIKKQSEYAGFELQDNEGNFIGLNIFKDGQCVYTWTKPEGLKV